MSSGRATASSGATAVAFAALHQRVLYRGEDTGLYVIALEDGRMFFSRRQPPLYDRQARAIAAREVLPGSYVNIEYRTEQGVNLMGAVQLVREPPHESPFDPIPDDGHL